MSNLPRALRAFDAHAFAKRHGGYKETRSMRSHEYLLPHLGPKPDGTPCGSERLRWRHEPGVKYAWVCWGCGKTGDSLDLIGMLEKTDRDGAIGIVVDGYFGGDAPTTLTDTIKAPTRREVIEHLPIIPWPPGYEQIDPRSPAHYDALHYLITKRGLTLDDVVRCRIGYARVGRLARYVIFPCFMDGGLVYWQGRATWDPPEGVTREQRKAWEKATRYRKTLNPFVENEHDTGSMKVLFNYDSARTSEHVVIVEGPIDALKVGPHAVALFGKVASPEKVERLLRMAARRYTVYLDPGTEEHARALELCAQLSAFAPTFITSPPAGYDPGKLTPAQNAWYIANATSYGQAAGLRSRVFVR